MISSVAWVPRGCAVENPVKFEPTEDELALARAEAEMSSMALDGGAEEEGEEEEGDGSSSAAPPAPASTGVDSSGLPADLRMDDYDDDEDMSYAAFANSIPRSDLPGIDEMSGDAAAGGEDSTMDSDEEEDTRIKPSDAILLAAHAEDEYSCLEVYVYDREEGSLFVHHDIALPAFPLALAWMGHPPGVGIAASGTAAADVPSGNFVAVGTFEPGIEIWNLDVLEALTPTATLGGRETPAEAKARASGNGSKKKRKKKGKKKKSAGLLPQLRQGSHKDAVLALSWNPMQRHILASGSADNVVKIWDVSACQCLASLTHHQDKVQAVAWHPVEHTVMASGAYDKTVAVFDVRSPNNVTSFATTADMESLQWNPHNAATFAVSTEDGNVALFDARNNKQPVWTLAAHAGGKSCSSVAFNSIVPGMMATASTDKTIKVWDISEVGRESGKAGADAGGSAGGGGPVCVESKSMGVGEVFCVNFYPDDPYILACGGEDGKVALWETNESSQVSRRFRGRVREAGAGASAAGAGAEEDAPVADE